MVEAGEKTKSSPETEASLSLSISQVIGWSPAAFAKSLADW